MANPYHPGPPPIPAAQPPGYGWPAQPSLPGAQPSNPAPAGGRGVLDFVVAGLLVLSMLLDLGHRFWFEGSGSWLAQWPVVGWIVIVFTPLVGTVLLLVSRHPAAARLTLAMAAGVLFTEHLFSIVNGLQYEQELGLSRRGGWLAIPGLLVALAAIILLYMAIRSTAPGPATPRPLTWQQPQFGGPQTPQWQQPAPAQPPSWPQPFPGPQQQPAGYPAPYLQQPFSPPSGFFPIQQPGLTPQPPPYQQPGFAPQSQGPAFGSQPPAPPQPGFPAPPPTPIPQPPNIFGAPQDPGAQPALQPQPANVPPPAASPAPPQPTSPPKEQPDSGSESTVHLPPSNPPGPQQ